MLPRSRNYNFSGSSDFICSTDSWWDLTGNSNYKGKNVSSDKDLIAALCICKDTEIYKL